MKFSNMVKTLRLLIGDRGSFQLHDEIKHDTVRINGITNFIRTFSINLIFDISGSVVLGSRNRVSSMNFKVAAWNYKLSF